MDFKFFLKDAELNVCARFCEGVPILFSPMVGIDGNTLGISFWDLFESSCVFIGVGFFLPEFAGFCGFLNISE